MTILSGLWTVKYYHSSNLPRQNIILPVRDRTDIRHKDVCSNSLAMEGDTIKEDSKNEFPVQLGLQLGKIN